MAAAAAPWLVIVTGASKGFGRCLAQSAVLKFADRAPLHFVLLARSSSGLRETADSLNVAPHENTVTAQCETLDLSNLDSLQAELSKVLEGLDARSFERAFLFNNAGSLGDLRPVQSMTSLADMRSAIDLNVTSSMHVSTAFARFLQQRQGRSSSSSSSSSPDVIVNVSSLAALQPFESWSVYCAGKAARDMFHAALALECKAAGSSSLKTLNYAPGPLDTDMQAQIRSSQACTESVRSAFEEKHKQGKLVDPLDSAAKCVRIVLQNEFVSGAHIDYYDD